MGIEKPILVDLLKQIKLKKTASPSQFQLCCFFSDTISSCQLQQLKMHNTHFHKAI